MDQFPDLINSFFFFDEEDQEGNITKIYERSNELIRPAVANVNQALIIFAAKNPKPNYNLLDRFLMMMEKQEVPVIVCFNKVDLAKEQDCSIGITLLFLNWVQSYKISQLSDEEKARGVIACSAGNHAQGVALAEIGRASCRERVSSTV